MSQETIDALFIPYYEDIDRWYDDDPGDDLGAAASGRRSDFSRKALDPLDRTDPGVPLADGFIRWSSLEPADHLYHTVHTRTARSCAFKCAFCSFPVNQRPLTLMPTEVFARELDELER